jgi:hypothetical protein
VENTLRSEKTNFNTTHPELRQGERFIGNARNPDRCPDFKPQISMYGPKARAGIQAYETTGKPLLQELWVPVFIPLS